MRKNKIACRRAPVTLILIFFVAASCVHTGEEEISPSSFEEAAVTVGSDQGTFATIQAAIDDLRTKDGDIIGILDPVHTEEGINVSKNIIIQGFGAENTVVQAHSDYGQATERVFFIPEGVSVTLRGMTVRHGNTTTCQHLGGGIYNKGDLIVESCIITRNSSSAGGGITNSGSLTIIDSVISFNNADGRGGDRTRGSGGGIKSGAGPVRIIDSRIEYNTTAFRGGGLKIGCGSSLDIINTTVQGNSARLNGGGIHLKGTARVTCCNIIENEASDAGGIMNDGELYIAGSRVTGNSKSLKWGAGDLLTGDEGSLLLDSKNLYDDMR